MGRGDFFSFFFFPHRGTFDEEFGIMLFHDKGDAELKLSFAFHIYTSKIAKEYVQYLCIRHTVTDRSVLGHLRCFFKLSDLFFNLLLQPQCIIIGQFHMHVGDHHTYNQFDLAGR